MREILFKAKRLDSRDWVEGFFWKDIWGDGESCYILYDGEDYEVDPSTCCEWTGLIDKNGTKVFEGDKIFDPHENIIFVVEHDPLETGFTLRDKIGRYVGVCRVSYSEVIGSIHDGEGGQHERVD